MTHSELRIEGDVMLSQVRSSKRQLLFDTSGVKELSKDATGAMVRAVAIVYSVRITGTNVAELGATRNSGQREHLLSTLRLLLVEWICLIPSRWVIRKHAEEFLKDSSQYVWQQLDVRSLGTERTIATDTLLDDENSNLLLAENTELEEQFNDLHKGERTRLDELMGNRAVSSFTEYCSVFLQDGGPAWTVGVSMFEQATNVRLDQRTLRVFLQKCPPWRAVFIALLWSHYRMCFIDPRGQSIKKAGRHDLMSAAYLPYCDVFVTNDEGQYGALSAIAQEAELAMDIWTYERFSQSILSI